MSFVPGRFILEAYIASHEATNKFRKKRFGRFEMAIKFDLDKAFDHVSWSLLFQLFHVVGFSQKFINLIRSCISNVDFELIVNSSTTKKLTSSQGLRQGCHSHHTCLSLV